MSTCSPSTPVAGPGGTGHGSMEGSGILHELLSPDTMFVTASAPPASPWDRRKEKTTAAVSAVPFNMSPGAATPVRTQGGNVGTDQIPEAFRTPLATASEADMMTPDNERTYTHVSHVFSLFL